MTAGPRGSSTPLVSAELVMDAAKVTSGNGLLMNVDPTSPQVDAFGRIRISDPFTLFDSQFHYDKQPLFWDESATGGASAASHNSNHNTVDMTLGTASGQSIIRQTFQSFRYQPGKSQLIKCTGVFGAAKANVRTRVGYFNGDNGVFLEINGTDGPRFVVRSKTSGSVVDTPVDQADWSEDVFDGSGGSGITIDFDKTQILIIDIEWLGVGTVRYGFVINGIIYWAHKAHHANSLTLPYMQTASLPMRYEIVNTGTAASGTTLKQICGTVISEGGFNPKGVVRAASRDQDGFTLSGIDSKENILTIELRSGYIGGMILPLGYAFVSATAAEFLVELILNPTVGGSPSFNNVSANSAVEFDVAGTTVSGGEVIWADFVSRDSRQTGGLIESSLNLGAKIDGTADRLTLAVTQRAGAAAVVSGAIMFKEMF